MTLFIQDREKWYRVIDSWPEWEVTAKEKLLARHLPDILDWCGEIASKNEDFWGNKVRVYPSMFCKQTGLARTTVWRILRRWNECSLVHQKSEVYMENDGQYHSRTFLEISQRFYDGDIRTGKMQDKNKRGVKKGHKFITCPKCGHRISKNEVHWQEIEQDGQESIEFTEEYAEWSENVQNNQ